VKQTVWQGVMVGEKLWYEEGARWKLQCLKAELLKTKGSLYKIFHGSEYVMDKMI
jgi:hypothetical protein